MGGRGINTTSDLTEDEMDLFKKLREPMAGLERVTISNLYVSYVHM